MAVNAGIEGKRQKGEGYKWVLSNIILMISKRSVSITVGVAVVVSRFIFFVTRLGILYNYVNKNDVPYIF